MKARHGFAATSLVVLGPLGALLCVHSPAGQSALRWAAETGARALLQGELHIGSVEGSLFGTLRLRDVRLVDDGGLPAAAADLLEVQHHVGALLDGELHVRDAEIRSLRVDVPRLLATLPAGSSDDQAPAAEPFVVRVDRARMNATRVILDTEMAIDDVQLIASATVTSRHIGARVDALTGRALGRRFTVQGGFHWTGTRISELEVTGQFGGVAVDLSGVPTATGTFPLDGRIQWKRNALETVRFAGTASRALSEPADMHFQLRGPLWALQVGINGTIGGSQVTLRAFGPRPAWNVEFAAHGVNPRRLSSSAPAGHLDVRLTGTASLTETAEGLRPSGQVRMVAKGAVQPFARRRPVRVHRLAVSAAVKANTLRGRVDLSTSAGRLEARARARPFEARPKFERAVVRLAGLRLEDFTPSSSLTGTVNATVTAAGDVFSPLIRADVSAAALAFETTKIDGLHAGGRISGPYERPRAVVWGRLNGLRHGAIDLRQADFTGQGRGTRWGRMTVTATGNGPLRGLDVAASMTRTGTGAEVRWSKLNLRTPAGAWTVTPGSVRASPRRLKISDFSARSAFGRIAADVDIDRYRWLDAGSRVAVELDQVDLYALTELVPHPTPTGRLSAKVVFDGEQPKLDAQLILHNYARSSRWPVTTARLSTSVTSGDVRLTTMFYGPKWGLVRATVFGDPPSPWRTPSAWLTPDLDALRSATLTFDLDLAEIPEAQEKLSLKSGRFTGFIGVKSRAQTMSARMKATSLATPDRPLVDMLTVTASASEDRIQTWATAQIGGHRNSTLVAQLDHGLRDVLAAPSWSDLYGWFRADINQLPLQLLALRLDRSTPRPPISGRLTVQARGAHEPSGPALRGLIRARDVRLAPDAPPIALTAWGELDREVTTATATLRALELGQHQVSVTAQTPALFAGAPLRAHLEALSIRSDGVSLPVLRAFGLDLPAVPGQVSLRARSGRQLRSLTATLTADQIEISRALAPLSVEARMTAGPRGIRFVGRSALGKAPFITAALRSPGPLTQILDRPDHLGTRPIFGEFRSDGFALARALVDAADRRDVEGRMVVTASVAGPWASARLRGRLRVDNLRLGSTRFDRFEVRHSEGPTGRKSSAHLRQEDGGSLFVQVAGDDTPSLHADVSARRFGLGFMSAIANLTDAKAAINGRLAGDLRLRGPIEAPDLRGALSVEDLELAVAGVPRVDRGTLDLKVGGRRATLQLEAGSGTGRMQVGLSAQVPRWNEPSVEGTFDLREVPVVASGQVIDVSLRGRVEGHRSLGGMQADVVFTEGLLRLPDIVARPRHPIADQPDVVFRLGHWRPLLPARRLPSESPRYRVRVRNDGPVEARGQALQAFLGLDLVAEGRRHGVAVSGDVRVEHGDVRLFGRRYEVDRAHVVVNGRARIEPRLDIRLSHKFEACTFLVGVVGSVDEPKIVLSAQPDIYDDKELFAFLFGASPDGDRYDKSPARQSLDLAAWLVVDQVRSRLKRALPFDTLAVDLGEGTGSGQANVTLGKWLTDQLFVAYAYRHGADRSDNASEGRVRYQFVRSWLLEMAFGDRGNGAADVLWTTRW